MFCFFIFRRVKRKVGLEFIWKETDDRTLIDKTTSTPTLSLSSSGTQTKPKAENMSAKREDNTTPIPILYKKNFTKLPAWDFDDVYLQDHKTEKPVSCFFQFRHQSAVYIFMFKPTLP